MKNYIKNSSKPKNLLTASLYVFIITIALISYGYRFPSANNIIEVPPIIALLDPELYKNDYYIQDTLQITPRYYYQYFVYLLAKSGLGIPRAYFLSYLLSFSSFVLGLYALGERFSKSKLSAAALVFLGLFTINGTVGYVSLFRTEPIPAVLAMGLSIWGVYFCLSKRWIPGYFLFGLACLIQFLVGFLPGLLMIPLLILDAKKTNNFVKFIAPLMLLGAFACLIYLPMALSGNTGSGKISDREFIFLYGYIRQPHHILPSAFAPQNWRSFFCLMFSGIIFIKISDSLSSEDKTRFLWIISASLVALFLAYICVEVFPIALIAKLQLARTTPFAQLIVLIVLSVLINEHYKQRHLSACILILLLPIAQNGAILLFLLAFGLLILKTSDRLDILRHRPLTFLALFGSIIFLIFYPHPSSFLEIFDRVFLKFFLLIILLYPFLAEEFAVDSKKNQVITYGLSILSFAFVSLGLLKILPNGLSSFVRSQIVIEQPATDDLTKLALRFRGQSHKDALVLTPPSSTRFRFYSQRSVVFNFYCSPYTDGGLIEWKKRLGAIVGVIRPPLSLRNIDGFYRRLNEAELTQIAKTYGAGYILTRSSWHPNLKGAIVARQGDWIIYQIANNS
jgi:drug/metabolite transporter (DMT)-like permease